MLKSMKPPIVVRPLTDEERRHLEGGLRSKHAFTVRRCQILLASAQHQPPAQMATYVGCSVQTVRNALHAFAPRGLGVPHRAVLRPTHGPARAGCREARVCPWPVAPESADVRQTAQPVDVGVVGRGLLRRRLEPPALERADHPGGHPASGGQLETRQTLDHQSRSGLCAKKNRRDRLIRLAMGEPTLALGFQDEVWWSRLAQPQCTLGRRQAPTPRGT